MRCKIGIFQGSFVQLLFFAALAAAIISFTVYGVYLRQMLQIRWRRWLTQHYVDMWLRDRSYYRLELSGKRTDNPDQRISEDINGFVSQTLILGLGLLESVVTLAAFAVILWE